MEKTILIAGKELPAGEDFASAAVSSGRRAVVTNTHENEGSPAPSGVTAVAWNRPSALSARSVVLKAINECGRIDECAVIFDEVFLMERYKGLETTTENVRVIEELISSYEYLTMEAMSRITKKNSLSQTEEKRRLKLIFVHKSNPSISECIISKSTAKPSPAFLSAAAAAFRAFAENTAATLVESEEIQPILISCDPTNELFKSDRELAAWLFQYVESLDGLRRPLTPKQRLTWTKAGAKSPGGFGIFG